MVDLFRIRVERIIQWAKGKKEGPVSLELVPTERCNLNCLSCWRRGWDKKKLEERFAQEMSDQRLLKLIDEGAEIGLKEVAFVGGGEPLLRSVMPQLIRKIKAYGMEGDLVTNGTAFNEKLIKEMVEIGWDRVKFSVDGVDEKTHDYLRGVKGTFKKVIKNIKTFSRLKKELKTDKPKLLFNTVISKENYRQLPELVKLGGKIGLNGIWLLPLTVFSECMKGMKLGKKELVEFKEILKESIPLAKKFGIEDNNFENFLESKYIEKTEDMDKVMMEEVTKSLNISDNLLRKIIKREYPKSRNRIENFKFLPCYLPWHHITILPNGNIAPCFSPWVWNTKVSVKNYSIKELWFGEYFDKFRKIILTRKLPENCKRCCVWEVFNNRKIRMEIDKYIKGGSAG
jgi:radical SAM protein with 4Fe4S-binding SPASM domain